MKFLMFMPTFFFLTKLSHFEQFSCFLPKKCSFRTVLSRLIHLLSKNKSFGSKDEWGRLSTVLNQHFFTKNNLFSKMKSKFVKIMDPKQQNIVDYINEKDWTFWALWVKNNYDLKLRQGVLSGKRLQKT